MNRAFAEINAAGDRIEVHFRYDVDLLAAIKAIGGARFVGKDRGGPYWTVPLSLDSGKRLSEEFGDRLVLGRALHAWGREASKRERELHALAVQDDVPIESLVIATKLPDLAKWLRPYQRADVKFLATTSALNLNEPGLGKTAETIGAIFEGGLEDGPHLVVAPKTSLDTVWRMEIERWTADLEKPHEVITYSGDLSGAARKAAIEEFWACVDEDWPVWFVCTPQTVRDGNEPFMDPKEFPDGWATFTIDEYHKTGLTNSSGSRDPKKNSKFAISIKDIKARRRYGITGTPMQGRVIRLWSGLNFLYPDQFTSKWAWAKNWLDINNNGFGNDIGGILRGREDDFYKALAPYVVRRLKKEVLPQLPDKQYVDVWCDMTAKQAKQYAAMADRAEAVIEDQALNALGILSEYTRLKLFADAYCDKVEERMVKCAACDGTGKYEGGQEEGEMVIGALQVEGKCPRCEGVGRRKVHHFIPSSDSGKLPYLVERLSEVGIDPKEPEGDACAVVSSQFKEVADMVYEYLNGIGIRTEKITGDTRQNERTRIQQVFQEGGLDSPRVIVMTTTAGGVSITLDRADTVHILDETWVPDDQEQLEDRVHRASRMHQVTCYYYRSKGTIEQDIMDVNIDKRNINRAILDVRRQGFRANMRKAAGVAA